jgi:hypothetical protein
VLSLAALGSCSSGKVNEPSAPPTKPPIDYQGPAGAIENKDHYGLGVHGQRAGGVGQCRRRETEVSYYRNGAGAGTPRMSHR